jgi:predicted hotdog family 3-hydroxylacyl-ACP dehydratase
MNLLKEEIKDRNFVQELIPQKAPFAMVDALYFFSEEKITAGLTVSSDNMFTKKDVFTAPGVIEHMAQTVALYTGYQYFLLQKEAPTGYIGSIKKVEIFELPKLKDSLKTTATIIAEFMGVTMVKISCECNGKIIAESEMKTVLAS